MRPREERQKIMIKARMRSGVPWGDVCILDASVHGLGIQSAAPPARGTYVEICRGTQLIVARVVWTKGHRAGLRSQEAIFIRALMKDETAGPSRAAPRRPIERRRGPRTLRPGHEESRLAGRAMEFACLTFLAGAMAVAAFGAVEQSLAVPLGRISFALG